jgi:hypothetical protein
MALHRDKALEALQAAYEDRERHKNGTILTAEAYLLLAEAQTHALLEVAEQLAGMRDDRGGG